MRHVHDLAAVGPVLEALDPETARVTMLRGETTHVAVAAVLEELARPVWRNHYERYMQRMGVLPVSDWPNSHPDWDAVLANITALAQTENQDKASTQTGFFIMVRPAG